MGDCGPSITAFCNYELSVVTGKIVQVFYIFTGIQEIPTKDKEIQILASNFSGIITGETGTISQRRDIDFAFPSGEHASKFKNSLNGSVFNFHKKLNKSGILVEYPSTEQIEKQRTLLVEILCD